MTSPGLRLCELATAHVGIGKLGAEHMGDIAEIDEILPAVCRYDGGTLWRVITVSDTMAEALKEGREVELDPRPYACWSKSQAALMRILRHRHTDMAEGEQLLLMRREVSAADKGIDVEALFTELGLKDHGPSWHQYAGLEQEVILQGGARVTPDMVMGIWDAQDYEAGTPVVGEQIDLSYDDVRKVDACIGLHNGGWLVTSGEETIHVVWDYGVLSGLPYTPDEEIHTQDTLEL